MSEVRDILNAAADLIEPEGAWTVEAEARNAAGQDIDVLDLDDSEDDTNPVCWCAGGAIFKAANKLGNNRSLASSALRFLESSLGVASVPAWNDEPGRTQAEVVAALRKAAEEA